MSRIFDVTLAPSGHDKINWVKSYMPTLAAIEQQFIAEQPFKNLRITTSIHLEAKTAYLAKVLKNGGATVFVTGCNPLSTQDDIAAALVDDGFEVFTIHGESEEDYQQNLIAALSHKPHLIIDDGGDLMNLLHGEHKNLSEHLIGGCEETTTGILRLKTRQAQNMLDFTMISVNDADCKHLFDNRYGTGQSTFDAIMNTTNLTIVGKNVVIAGYGWCGKGVAMRAKGLGARVTVTEIDPVKAIEAVMDGFDVMPMKQAAKIGDIFITLTGCNDVITEEHMIEMKDGVILANSGHFDVEINKNHLEKLAVSIEKRKPNIVGYTLQNKRTLNLLAEGRLVNLAAGNGHPAEIMDMSFAIQAKCLEYLAKTQGSLDKKLYPVPPEIDAFVAHTKLRSMGYAIDQLTQAQQDYIRTF